MELTDSTGLRRLSEDTRDRICGMDTPFTRRLGLRYPIVQGPFGGGFSSARLTATVSNAGGLGSFGAQGQPPERMGEIVSDIQS